MAAEKVPAPETGRKRLEMDSSRSIGHNMKMGDRTEGYKFRLGSAATKYAALELNISSSASFLVFRGFCL